MRVAVIGSRSLSIDISKYIPKEATEIITGGAEGIDALAERYADEHRISKHVIRPDYGRHGKAAPLVRNQRIVNLADLIIAFWDGESGGTAFTVKYARQVRKPLKIFKMR
jgi:predicted Rossmann fold nucleotide-binding protein DprA/Smf involved in DNA uptake